MIPRVSLSGLKNRNSLATYAFPLKPYTYRLADMVIPQALHVTHDELKTVHEQFSFTISNHIHPWHYSPFRVLVSLKSCLHSSLFSALLLHPRVLNICNASCCTASSHLILGLPTGLVLLNFPFRTIFVILPSSLLIM